MWSIDGLMAAWRDWRSRTSSLADGSRADVLVEDDHVLEVLPTGWRGRLRRPVVDGGGGLLLPAYVDTHVHLDKVLIRDQLVEHDGTLRGAIDAIHAAKRATPSRTYGGGRAP